MEPCPEPEDFVTTIQSALLVAAQPQPSAVTTSKPPLPALALTDALDDASCGPVGIDAQHAPRRQAVLESVRSHVHVAAVADRQMRSGCDAERLQCGEHTIRSDLEKPSGILRLENVQVAGRIQTHARWI